MTDPQLAPSIEDVVTGNDETVAGLLAALGSSEPGAERADLAHRLVGAVTVHDAVIAEALCPLVAGLSGGAEMSETMAAGCAEREKLTKEIQSLVSHVQPRYVYLSGGERLEAALSGLAASFDRHRQVEVPRALELLASAPDAATASGVAASVDEARRWAPTRPHRGPLAHRRAMAARALLHLLDRGADRWDHREGWSLD